MDAEWATGAEIFMTAWLTNVDVFVYSLYGQVFDWNTYPESSKEPSKEAIYLENNEQRSF